MKAVFRFPGRSLALIGGLLGIGAAYTALRLLVSIGSVGLPRVEDIALDARALTFALLVSLSAGVLLGLAPALKYPRWRIAAALHGVGRTVGISRDRHRAQNVLVVGQVALLVGSGLMIRTFQALGAVDVDALGGAGLPVLLGGARRSEPTHAGPPTIWESGSACARRINSRSVILAEYPYLEEPDICDMYSGSNRIKESYSVPRPRKGVRPCGASTASAPSLFSSRSPGTPA